MKSLHLEIPVQEYTHLLNTGTFSDKARTEIKRAIEQCGSDRVIVFGSQSTGLALRELLAERFLRFVDSETLPTLKQGDFDAVLLGTSPLHYPTILSMLGDMLESESVDVITPFNVSSEVEIRLVVETQPRSGTHYIMDNLMRSLQWEYGTVFREETDPPLRRSRDGRFGYVPSGNKRGYLVKTHFFQPLCFPEYRYLRTLFQTSFVFDSYYSWGKMLTPAPGPGYRLRETSKEWAILRSYIPINKEWLFYIRDRFFVRYEDYYRDFDTTIRRISDFLGVPRLEGFEPPRRNSARTYWSDEYSEVMDKSVFSHLFREFREHIEYYWPEKVDRLNCQ